ncbi:hypothetical protein [Treponema sp.]|uniref:hypothetical protein n=1 Tax=Treponema sp. TaxID=166 RepID=UPI003F068893
MFGLVPGKDALLFLVRMQKKSLSVFNSRFSPEYLASPVFPLWAFSDFPFPENFESFDFMIPVFTEGRFVFPAEIKFCSSGRQEIMHIEFEFGKVLGEKKELPDFQFDKNEFEVFFPHRIKSFKTGTVLAQNNCWQLFDEKWCKASVQKQKP